MAQSRDAVAPSQSLMPHVQWVRMSVALHRDCLAERISTNMATRYAPMSLRTGTSLIIGFATLAYLATLTADYYWDGITFALQIEKVAKMQRGTYLLFHQNHLLYNGLGYLLYRIANAVSPTIRGLYVLQIANTVAGAAGVGIFFRMAERLSGSRYLAVISSAVLAFSAVWWKLATDADAYIVSVLLMLICANTLLSSRPRCLLAGLSLAGAMLMHQLASLFYLAAMVAIFTSPSIEKKRSFAAKFSTLAWGTTIACYYLCANLFHDIKEPLGLANWAVSNQSGVSPSSNPLRGLALLLRGNLETVVGHSFALYRNQGGWPEKLFAWGALILLILLLLMFARTLRSAGFLKGFFSVTPQAREVWKACAPMLIAWIGTYIIFLIFWEPWQVLYRVFYLPPLALALGLALRNYHTTAGNSPTAVPVVAVGALLLFNLAFYISPHMRAASNPLVVAARDAQHIWNGKTVIYFAGHTEADTAFEYFNDQTEWRRFTAVAQVGIDDEIQLTSSQGGQVWLNKGAAELVDSAWLAPRAHGREIILESPNASVRYVELLTY